jgi:hypothetical protein
LRDLFPPLTFQNLDAVCYAGPKPAEPVAGVTFRVAASRRFRRCVAHWDGVAGALLALSAASYSSFQPCDAVFLGESIFVPPSVRSSRDRKTDERRAVMSR